MTQKS